MSSRSFHFAVVWLLLVAQAIVVGSPAGLLVCRDSDGSSHIEWAASQCCAGGDLGQDPERSETSDQCRAPELESCRETTCVDEPIEVSPAVTDHRSREGKSNADSPATPSLLQLASTVVWSQTTTPTSLSHIDDGPPRQMRLSLTSIVLIL